MGTVMFVTPAGTSRVTVWNTPMYGAATRKLKSSGLSFVENVSGTNWYMSVQLVTASSAPTISVNDWYLAGSDTGCSRSKIHKRPSSVPVYVMTHHKACCARESTQTVQTWCSVQCAYCPIAFTVQDFRGDRGMDQRHQKKQRKKQQPSSLR